MKNLRVLSLLVGTVVMTSSSEAFYTTEQRAALEAARARAAAARPANQEKVEAGNAAAAVAKMMERLAAKEKEAPTGSAASSEAAASDESEEQAHIGFLSRMGGSAEKSVVEIFRTFSALFGENEGAQALLRSIHGARDFYLTKLDEAKGYDEDGSLSSEFSTSLVEAVRQYLSTKHS